MNFDEYVAELTSATGKCPDHLLQYLYDIQHQYGCIPEPIIKRLADTLSLSEAHIQSVIGFYSFLHTHSRGAYDVLFSHNITDLILGSRALLNSLAEKLGVQPGITRQDERVTLGTTSCTGMCDQGPAMLVNGWAITRLDADRINRIADLIESETPVEHWPVAFFRVDDNIQRRDILLSDNSDNGAALQSLCNQGKQDSLQQLQLSGLRGRGGAGFSTALKWQMCQLAEADQRYVVCNADEGEPGTFKDRVLLSTMPDRVFEGMTLCGGIVGASKGLLYLRGEYRYLRAPLEKVLQARRDAGLLGTSIIGNPGFDFDIEIHMGAGAYICGEESALIESLEGKRGIPRNRPPFPVTQGYKNKPTVVNNVETFMAAALIAAHGASWFRQAGTAESSGTKLLSISGDCDYPGIYEYPFATSIRKILKDCGAHDTQAVQISGAAGVTISAREFDRKIAFEDIPTGGSFMIFSQHRDLLQMVQNFSHFFAHESCGFCTPCRVGGTLMKDLIDKLQSGHASRYDLDELRMIAALMRSSSHCGLGATAPNPVLDMLNKFPEAFEQQLRHTDYEPAFDLDAALEEARKITGRDDVNAHIERQS